RFPILAEQARIITDVAWEDLPENTIAQMKTETGIDVPPGFPIFEKGLHIIPVQVGDQVLYLVLLHTVSPAFDPINPYRNFDELRALRMFLDGELPGVEPLPVDAKFVVIGDLNADPDDGDGLPGAIEQIIDHPSVVAAFPSGAGTKGQNGQYNSYLSGCGLDNGTVVQDPTTKFQLQLDYILPSATIGQPLETFIFFPDFMTEREDFDLACRASDHRFLYADIEM
ncbi:MAG TPA: endonuclease/exonuclease/phosphatase family protein, partial [Polyangiaceae bacterium]|nr:endonuclease/exonuclease/phosphatase family protein [Polyangiaceae bacterium]